MKKIKALLVILTMFLVTGNVTNVEAKEKVNVYLFYGDGCPYCEKAEEYFTKGIEDDYKDKFNFVKYEVWNNQDNANVMNAVAKKLGEEVNGVPYIVIGDKTINGYSEEYNEQIKQMIDAAYESGTDSLKGLDVKGKPENVAGANVGQKGGSNSMVYVALFIIFAGVAGLIYFAKKSVTE